MNFRNPEFLLSIILVLITLVLPPGCTGDRAKKGEEQKSRQDSLALQAQQEMMRARTMGLAYLEEGDLEKAEQEFTKLTELAPGEAIGYANLGLVYLRMGRYEEAEKQLKKAIELDPEDPDIRLNLARVYEYSDKSGKSIRTLEKTIEIAPDHLQSLYSLAESYGGGTDKTSMDRWEEYMLKVVETTPANIVPRLHLIEALLRNNKPDSALANLEEIERLYPEFHAEARQYYDEAVNALQEERNEDALTTVLIFHNLLKLTNPYQKGIAELKGYSGSVGVPVISFSETARAYIQEGETILDAIRFTDVTLEAGLENVWGRNFSGQDKEAPEPHENAHIATGDMDHDGDPDIYLGTPSGTGFEHYLFRSDLGGFTEISEEAGLTHGGRESHALFADYDNDGWLDLHVTAEKANYLYKSTSEARYTDVSREAGLGPVSGGRISLFFDMDHEGDLDLFTAASGSNYLLRNNSDGTFSNKSQQTRLEGSPSPSIDAAFADFDDDGDIDLFVLNRELASSLFDNQREGRFLDIGSGSGADIPGNAVACGDCNNDGYPDLLIAGNSAGEFSLLLNEGTGKFRMDSAFGSIPGSLNTVLAHDLEFMDFDNDGYLDILIAGRNESPGGSGLVLLHNAGNGTYDDVSELLPPDPVQAHRIATADFNNDGDLDLFLAGIGGGMYLLRNDGGNINHRLKMQLVGVRTGSGKNNHYGIGSKIEVRAGDLYQMKVVTDPLIHFGLGERSSADVVRIQWTNGTPQNIFSPGTDQDMVEEQQLKGSCPFLYAWNGEGYEFVKDVMWRSALGMPLGIMGEISAYAFADASVDYHKIPGEALKAKKGKYSLQVTEELWETIYFDEVKLILLDHPDSIEVFVNEKFSAPPYPEHKVYKISRRILPESVLDGKGNDLTEKILATDDQYISNFERTSYQGITNFRELDISPAGTGGDLPDSLLLFLTGWIFPTDASINVAISQTDKIQTIPPCLQVLDKEGNWKTVIENIGFPEGKNKTVIVDLSGKFLSDSRKVRICTNMEIYWDCIFFAENLADAPVQTSILVPTSADHHYRGFSRLYRKGGRYGPHWFDYSTVDKSPRWRDLTGNYTRYGDVTELLLESDNRYIVANSGEETTLEFEAGDGKLKPGWKRDFLFYTVGWVKDGDLNTATGQTVEPLPFHGMESYPYPDNISYPDEIQEYLDKYNTRTVTGSKFNDVLRNPQKERED